MEIRDLSLIERVLFGVFGLIVIGGALFYQTVYSVFFKRWDDFWGKPSPDDSPIAALRKLHKKHLGPKPELAVLKRDGGQQSVYLLEPWNNGRNAIWVAPSIIYKNQGLAMNSSKV